MNALMPEQRMMLLSLHKFLSAVLKADKQRAGSRGDVKRLSLWVSMETLLWVSCNSSIKEPGLRAPSSGSAHTDITARHNALLGYK